MAEVKQKNDREILRNQRLVFCLLIVFATLYLWRDILVSIESGHRGVLWQRFWGTDVTQSFPEGLNVLFPWDIMYIYNLRLLEVQNQHFALTKDGLRVDYIVSTRYKLRLETLPLLHQDVGPDYEEKVINPEIINGLRLLIGKYRLEELYYKDEAELTNEMITRIQTGLEKAFTFHEQKPPYIIFVDTMIVKLEMPSEVQNAIKEKLIEEQNFLKYKFSINKAVQEKERKTIEAEGLKKFEEISNVDILQWRGIEATLELAKSPNEKIIIVSANTSSLPLILNPDSKAQNKDANTDNNK